MTPDELRETARKIAADAPPVSPAVKAAIGRLLREGRAGGVQWRDAGAA